MKKGVRFFLLMLAITLSTVIGLGWINLHHAHLEPESMNPGPGSAMSELVPPIINTCDQLYRLACTQTGETRDPTGSVHPDSYGEQKAAEETETITSAHPDWTAEQVDQQLSQNIYTDRRVARLRGAFRWVQHSIERFLDRQPNSVLSASEKKVLKARIRRVQLDLPTATSQYPDEPDLITKTDVVYERTEGTPGDGRGLASVASITRLRVGGAFLLSVKSWFNLVFTLGHELGHSIDPCELRQSQLAIPAYDRLTACFVRTGLVKARKTRFECGDNDQLSETFADWMGGQVTSEALATYATEFHGPQLVSAAVDSIRDLCEQDNYEPDTDLYPEPKIRIDQIFGLQPQVRQALDCGSPPLGKTYCDFQSSE